MRILGALIAYAITALAAFPTSGVNDLLIKDADTIQLDGTIYRLDGIDAPELDQACLDEPRAVWACGVEARDRLTQHIGTREMRCDDKGADTVYRERRVGICTVEGDSTTINQWLVRGGLALNFDPYARGRYQRDQGDAQENRRDLWKGCFVAPWDFRHWRKRTARLMGSCPDAGTARDALFPDQAEMPSGCTIKGMAAVRARITGYGGIYHLEDAEATAPFAG